MKKLLKHPHRRKTSIGLVVFGGALLFLAPEAGGWIGVSFVVAGLAIEGLAVYLDKQAG